MAIKCEPRGKFAGIKAHLDEIDCQGLLDAADESNTIQLIAFAKHVAKLIRKLLKEEPNLLLPRTPDQIEAELVEEQKKASKKLAKAGAGLVWNDKADPTCHLVVFPSGKVQMHCRSVFGEWDDWPAFLSEAAIPLAQVRVHPLVKGANASSD